jgi:hypothetical protein
MAEATPANEMKEVVFLLKELLTEMRTISEVLILFTSDGLPLRQQIPTPDLMAACSIAAGLVANNAPIISAMDLQARLQASQVIAATLISEHDSYMEAARPNKLEDLLRR